jgi:cytidylate kinase
VQAPDAVLLDTSHMAIEEQIEWVIEQADKRLAQIHRQGRAHRKTVNG